MSAYSKHLLPGILILVSGFLCYANSFTVPFVLDDVTSILVNPNIAAPAFVLKPRLFGELSFALNYHLHGFALPGYHLLNLVFHLFCSLLVYLLVITLFRTPLLSGVTDENPDRSIACAAALLFVAHPLQTAAVTYLAQRVTLLAALFYLAAVLLYLRSRLSSQAGTSVALFIMSMISAAAALLSKENAVTVPVAILLCEFTFFKGIDRKRILLCGLCFLPVFAAILLTNRAVLLQTDLPAAFLKMTAERGAPSRLTYLLTQFPVVLEYLRLFFLPFGQSLDHDVPLRSSWSDPVVAASFLSLLAIIVSALLIWLKGKKGEALKDRILLLAGFGVAWFFITISLESGLVPIRDVMFEQRVYLPSAGLVVTVSSLLWFCLSKWSFAASAARNFSIVILIMASTFAFLTLSRNRVWRSEVTLWEDAAGKSPAKGRTHGALGHAYQRAGRFVEAERAYVEAVRLAPQDYIARNNLGAIYLKQRRYGEAVSQFKGVLTLAPATAAAHFNLGLAYAALGQLAEAETSFAAAVRLKPDYREASENLTAVRKARRLSDLE